MVASIFTSCAQSYTGKYFDITYVTDVTQEEYEVYNAKDGNDALTEFLKLYQSHEGEKLTNRTDVEVKNFLLSKNISEKNAADIITAINKLSEGEGRLESFTVTNGETSHHDIYWFQFKK